MTIREEKAIDELISYVDNNTYISLEDTKTALTVIYPKDTNNYGPKEKQLMLKIVELINKRTEEAEYFVETITNKKITEEERKIQGLKYFPFKNSNLNVEKLIIETAYRTGPYQTFEDLIIDLIYDTAEDPDELKEEIRNFIKKLEIIIDTSKPFNPEENSNNLSYTKIRNNK